MIQINHLRFRYPKGKSILNDISLDFTKGNIYGLFGKNGEGKTSLMKIMAGLLFAKSGSFTVNADNGLKRGVQSLRHLFLVPEDFELSGVSITTYEKINAPFYPQFSREEFYKLIGEFDLSKNDNIARLSFGQKKKVLIAFGIATNTELLLMDEPTNGLDIPSKSQFRRIMASVSDENKCIIISTHQVRDLHSLINHIVVLDHAKVVFDQALSNISEHLWFGKPKDIHKGSAVYSEVGFNGKIVLQRDDLDETEVDLELLFNAVLSEPLKMNEALNIDTNDTRD